MGDKESGVHWQWQFALGVGKKGGALSVLLFVPLSHGGGILRFFMIYRTYVKLAKCLMGKPMPQQCEEGERARVDTCKCRPLIIPIDIVTEHQTMLGHCVGHLLKFPMHPVQERSNFSLVGKVERWHSKRQPRDVYARQSTLMPLQYHT